MGLAQDLTQCVSGQPEMVRMYANIANNMESEQAAWVAELRALGVKAAHPDDGWVDRKTNTVCFAYPQFDDGAKIGDLIALGWPQWSCAKPQHRIVRIVDIKLGFTRQWVFEPATTTTSSPGRSLEDSHTALACAGPCAL